MMPATLELRSDCLINPTAYDVAVVGAAMLYPQDKSARERALYATTITMMLENGDYPPAKTVAERRQEIEIIRTAPRVTEYEGEIREGFRRGMLVGGLVRDVVFHGARLTDSKRRLAKSFGVSVSLIDGVIWPAYKPVAAYWGVFVRADQALVDAPIPCAPADLGRFLAMVDDLRSTAETLKRPHAQTLLKCGETIQIPKQIVLPAWPKGGRDVFYKEAGFKLK